MSIAVRLRPTFPRARIPAALAVGFRDTPARDTSAYALLSATAQIANTHYRRGARNEMRISRAGYWIGFAFGVGLTTVAVLVMLWRGLGE